MQTSRRCGGGDNGEDGSGGDGKCCGVVIVVMVVEVVVAMMVVQFYVINTINVKKKLAMANREVCVHVPLKVVVIMREGVVVIACGDEVL